MAYKSGDLSNYASDVYPDLQDETLKNPYHTFIAYNEGATRQQRAHAYFADFKEILGALQPHAVEQMANCETYYHHLVDALFDDGDVTLEELRGYVFGVAVAFEIEPAEREWLHDAFWWVLK